MTQDTLKNKSESDNVLEAYMSSQNAPEPTDLLAGRILAQAKRTPQRSETGGVNWMHVAAMFVIIFAVGVIGLQSTMVETETSTTEDVWLEAANDLGVSDVYNWVMDEAQ